MEASEEKELAEKIILLDDSIIACGFVTHNGNASSGATKEPFRSKMPKAEFWQRGEKLWESIAFRATQILADAKTIGTAFPSRISHCPARENKYNSPFGAKQDSDRRRCLRKVWERT